MKFKKISILQVKGSIIANNKNYSCIIVFSISIFLRLIPEILASPYPIGYDVINYYLPIMKNFDHYWPAISNQFPLYISLLHMISEVLRVDPRIVITSSIILIFGLFSLVIFSIARNLLHLNNLQSIFLSLFVIFQLSVLRTSWDLHKDMLALTLTFFCLSYISKIPNLSKKIIAVITSLSIFSGTCRQNDRFPLNSEYHCIFFCEKRESIGINRNIHNNSLYYLTYSKFWYYCI